MMAGRVHLHLHHRLRPHSSKAEKKAGEQASFRIPGRGLLRLSRGTNYVW